MVGGLYDCWPISGLTGYYDTRMAVPCYLNISVTPEAGASSTSGTLTFTLASEMGLDTDAKLHAIINESGIPGTGTYAGSEFDYALRWNLGGENGHSVSFGSSSETIEVDLDYTIDGTWDWNELYLTTFVQSNATDEILNSHMIKLTDLITTSIEEDFSGINVTPNIVVHSPSYGAISYSISGLEETATINLFSLDGRIVETQEVQNTDGIFTPDASGVYILRLDSQSGFSVSRQVVVIK